MKKTLLWLALLLAVFGTACKSGTAAWFSRATGSANAFA